MTDQESRRVLTRAALTLLLGGVRAGKSARAVTLAAARRGNGSVLFVATAEALDDEIRERIDAHRRERPADWRTVESPLDLAADIARVLHDSPREYSVIIVDCLTVWVSNILLSLPDTVDGERDVAGRARALLNVLTRATSNGMSVILVSNEVGLGVVPPTALGRRYRDMLGRANQLAAAAADEVLLLIAGIELPLKTPPPDSQI